MAAQEASPGSQSEESCVLDLPSAYDLRDYVLPPSQEASSESLSSVGFNSSSCSSDVHAGNKQSLKQTNMKTITATLARCVTVCFFLFQ
jgi:hypothetical protein|uniref:Uncharacterized protein C20orf196 homolog n=1 Tax=Castor canadensis TaxID=51338 RepID=A0A8B7UU28_CASCN|nr:uncharacterized protein C20orf196 homolog [Castor canadensis]XP_020022419.1 uncharacterized protein C20orf196 homolog [Castor canadensis]XP_020022420.1 uncharacterized protein C20orf196 homolog [Castor canadensis]